MTKTHRRVWLMIALLAGMALVGVGVFVGYCLFASSEEGGLWGLSPPLILRQQSYMEVIRRIESGRLPIANHVVNLPPDYKSIARKVYAERRADGRLFVLFVTFVGRGDADVTGYLYCSRPLGSADFHIADWGSSGIHKGIDAFGVGDLEPVHIRGPWYHVCRRLG
jgi:hypothetical protein